MRRKWYVALAFALTAALAAPAGAGLPSVELENQYEGRVERDPFTYFGFDVIGRAGQKRVANVTAHIGYTCDDGNSRRESAQVEGRLRIKKRRFAGVLETSLTPDVPPILSGRCWDVLRSAPGAAGASCISASPSATSA